MIGGVRLVGHEREDNEKSWEMGGKDTDMREKGMLSILERENFGINENMGGKEAYIGKAKKMT